MSDSWIPGVPGMVKKFFDIKVYNSDTYKVDEHHPVIAEMYFRIDVDAYVHSRAVFTFMNWLGAIGGVDKVLMLMVGTVIGGYSQFNATLQIINQQSCDEDCPKPNSEEGVVHIEQK